MKICQVSNFLPGHHKVWAGAEQACHRISNLLLENGLDVCVMTVTPDFKVKEKFGLESIEITRNYAGKILKNIKGYDKKSFNSSDEVFKRISPDVVHLNNFDEMSFGVVKAAKKNGIPIVFSVYDFWLFCPKRTLMYKNGEKCKFYHGSECADCMGLKKTDVRRVFLKNRRNLFDKYFEYIDKFIVLSDSWSRIMQDYGIEKGRIVKIPLPLRDMKMKKKGTKKNTILYVGWIKKHKGLHIAIKAMEDVVKSVPDAKLYAIGSNDDKKEEKFMIDLIEELKLKDKVFILGKKPYKIVEKYLMESEVVIVPEQWEIALPIFLTEAMLFSNPIVASKIGGIPEFIDDGKNGFLVNPHDPLEFSRKITWFLKNRSDASKMGKLAREKIVKKCGKRRILNELLNVYKSVID